MGCWGSRAQHSSAPLHIKNTRPKFHFDWSLNWLQSFNLTLDMSYIFFHGLSSKSGCPCSPYFPSDGAQDQERNVPKSSSVDVLPCPQTRVPAAICSLLPWFPILHEQKCDVASREAGAADAVAPPWPAGRITAFSGHVWLLEPSTCVGLSDPSTETHPHSRHQQHGKQQTQRQKN